MPAVHIPQDECRHGHRGECSQCTEGGYDKDVNHDLVSWMLDEIFHPNKKGQLIDGLA